MKKLFAALVITGFLLGCSSNQSPATQGEANAPKQAEKKPAETLLGRSALQKMYLAAHSWMPDAGPYYLESQPTKDAPGANGLAAVWRSRFGSARKASSKEYGWSGSDAEDAPSRGINQSAEDSYSPSNSSQHVFDLGFLKSDSDKA